jgi:hypothetical protein
MVAKENFGGERFPEVAAGVIFTNAMSTGPRDLTAEKSSCSGLSLNN